MSLAIAAAAVTLDLRGTGGCGWSYAWKMGLRARLYDGEQSLDQLRALLTKSSLPNLFSLCGRALQVDGNLGATAAIAEMLVQSHQDVIRLLPALPAEWADGNVKGLRARGGFEVDVAWAGARVTRASIRAHVTRRCRLQAKGRATATTAGRRVPVVQRDADTIEFGVIAGRSYDVVFAQAR